MEPGRRRGADLLQDGKGNPHADRFGDAAVWHFWGMADSHQGQRPAGDAALEAWDRAAAGTDRAAVDRAAGEFQKAFTTADARSPFWIKNVEDEKTLPAATRTELARFASEIDALKKIPAPTMSRRRGAGGRRARLPARRRP